MTIPIAHDFICEWCWIGLFQAKRMRREFGATLDWLGYELYPSGLADARSEPSAGPPPNKPLTPSRLTLAFAAAGLEPVRRPRVNTHSALELVEFAKQLGVVDEIVERIYYAYWKEGKDISNIEVLQELSTGLIAEDITRPLEEKRFADKITRFNEDAQASGVWNLPTFWIGGERYSEQPWIRLSAALGKTADTPDFYSSLNFPIENAPADRPYAFINMVATIDGKIVTGNRGEPVEDLGSKTDHIMMRRIQSAAEGVLIGAGAQRSSNKVWYPKDLFRFVATRSGNVLTDSRFFSDAPDKAFIICPDSAHVPAGFRTIRAGKADVDWKAALAKIRKELGIKRLLIEGGSDINAQLLKLELVDELFLTIAPKIKLGADTPTYADGEALPRELVQKYKLIEEHRWLDEVFLRYRRS